MYDYETVKKNFEGISDKDKLSYKEMCEFTGDKFTTNTVQRKRQVSRWQVIINYKKKKNYFTKIRIKNYEEFGLELDYFNKIQSVLQNIEECKNYKELCRLLDEPILRGNSRDSQMKKWKIYFTWSSSGNKYIKIRPFPFDKVLYNLTEQGQEAILKRNKTTEKNREEKYKNFSLTHMIVSRTDRRGNRGRNSYKKWGERGVYLILNKTKKAKEIFGKKVCYIGSTNVSFYERFVGHLGGGIPETKNLLEMEGTQIDFLYLAEEDDSAEFILEKEAEYWAEYNSKGYVLLNKKIPYYHKSSKKKKVKKNSDYGESYFKNEDWLRYRKSKIKIKGEKFPRLIKFLREELDLEYSEDFDVWTEKEIIPKIQEYMQNKNDNKNKSEIKFDEVKD